MLVNLRISTGILTRIASYYRQNTRWNVSIYYDPNVPLKSVVYVTKNFSAYVEAYLVPRIARLKKNYYDQRYICLRDWHLSVLWGSNWGTSVEKPRPSQHNCIRRAPIMLNNYIDTVAQFVYVTANLRNQLFPGIFNPFRESGESLKWISSKLSLVT